jgi:hypothetical protein
MRKAKNIMKFASNQADLAISQQQKIIVMGRGIRTLPALIPLTIIPLTQKHLFFRSSRRCSVYFCNLRPRNVFQPKAALLVLS